MRSQVGAFLWLVFVACEPVPPTPLTEAEPGAPLPGLTAGEAAQFVAGKELFGRAFTPADGLGPIFNQRRCSSCHDLPTSGGHGAETVTQISSFDEAEGCSLLEEVGGPLLQASVVQALRDLGIAGERIPRSATAATEVRPPPLYGLGLVGAVDEADIRGRAESVARGRTGISGRVSLTPDGAVGRFGAKGQHATLESFVESALNGELGLTTAAHPLEQLPNGLPLPEGVDPTPDPEIDQSQISLLTDYVRFLAPPHAQVSNDPETRLSVEDGERLFEQLDCAACHTPTMVTAPNELGALDSKRFRIYSDLLLHDMGPELADVCVPGVAPSEWITSRLVGLRYRFEFMHNRRAQGLEAAIFLHGGEAAGSRSAYRALGPDDRERLMRFLRSL